MSLNDELLTACGENKLEDVNKLLAQGANIECSDSRGYKPIHIAAIRGHLNIVKELAHRGANLRADDGRDWAPMPLAAWAGQLAVVQYFVDEQHVDIDFQDNEGWTALHKATRNGHVAIVKFLLSRGADYQKQTTMRGSETIEKIISIYNRHEIARLLEQVKQRDNSLRQIVDAGDVTSFRLLSRVVQTSTDKGTLLHEAAAKGEVAMVVELLPFFKNCNPKNKQNETPLHLSVLHGMKAVVECLISQEGVEINAQDINGNTPLHVAVLRRQTPIVEMLRGRAADLTIKNDKQQTPLDIAKRMELPDLVARLRQTAVEPPPAYVPSSAASGGVFAAASAASLQASAPPADYRK